VQVNNISVTLFFINRLKAVEMKKKSFALLEIGNHDCPMIGVVANISNDEGGLYELKQKFIEAVSSHFDTDDFNYDELPDVFDGAPSYEIMLEIDGFNYEIEIVETWIY
jgi:hypothetical protein